MKEALLLDSNILVDYLRGKIEAVNYIEKLTGPLFISSMTVAELYAGIRQKQEKIILDQFIRAFNIIPVDESISKIGGEYKNQYGKSHNTDLIDALIAATAFLKNLSLVTLNKKHFPMLKKIIVPY